jgi:hypothetical protein
MNEQERLKVAHKWLDRAIMVIGAAIIIMMVAHCKASEANETGVFEKIMVCYAIAGEPDIPEQCEIVDNKHQYNEEEIEAKCVIIREGLKIIVPTAYLTKCGLERESL